MIIYLDQNKWIDIAKAILKPDENPKYVDVALKILEKANDNEWIFPISMIHFLETLSRADIASRERLADTMALIAKNNSIKSFIDVETDEFTNLFASVHDLTKLVDIKAVEKNLFPAIGAKSVGVSFHRNLSADVKESINEFLCNLHNDEKLFSKFMVNFDDDELISEIHKDDQESVNDWNKMRLNLLSKPKEHRYKVFLLENFIMHLASKNKILMNYFGKSREDFLPDSVLSDPLKTLEFLEGIPSLNTRTKLMFEVLKDQGRPIQLHDSRDIAFLSTAIPYCDVVITEKTWKHAAKMQKLNTKYSTIIENDLNFLLRL